VISSLGVTKLPTSSRQMKLKLMPFKQLFYKVFIASLVTKGRNQNYLD
jgi:hypothetical protein